MFQKGSFIVIVAGAIEYTIYSVLGTSISSEMAELYDLNPLLSDYSVFLPALTGSSPLFRKADCSTTNAKSRLDP